VWLAALVLAASILLLLSSTEVGMCGSTSVTWNRVGVSVAPAPGAPALQETPAELQARYRALQERVELILAGAILSIAADCFTTDPTLARELFEPGLGSSVTAPTMEGPGRTAQQALAAARYPRIGVSEQAGELAHFAALVNEAIAASNAALEAIAPNVGQGPLRAALLQMAERWQAVAQARDRLPLTLTAQGFSTVTADARVKGINQILVEISQPQRSLLIEAGLSASDVNGAEGWLRGALLRSRAASGTAGDLLADAANLLTSAGQGPTFNHSAQAAIDLLPNPVRFQSSQVLEIEVSGGGALKIFDAAGRLRYSEQLLGRAVPQRLIWDGRDLDGALAEPGKYIVRITNRQGLQTRPLIVVP
jgi:hypothetical protein